MLVNCPLKFFRRERGLSTRGFTFVFANGVAINGSDMTQFDKI